MAGERRAEPAGPRTLAARALLTRGSPDRSTMRGVATAELAKLLARIEQEAAAPYRAELGWALDRLAECDESGQDAERRARIRNLLDEG